MEPQRDDARPGREEQPRRGQHRDHPRGREGEIVAPADDRDRQRRPNADETDQRGEREQRDRGEAGRAGGAGFAMHPAYLPDHLRVCLTL